MNPLAALRHIADEADAGLALSPEHQKYALRSILQRARAAMLEGPEDPAASAPNHRAKPVSVTAIWLRREGPHAVVLIEVEGARYEWVEVVREFTGPPTPESDVPFSHIVEALGIRIAMGTP